jgi:DNA-directed RNA polymerase sigma subunit (sigma70/sigma32)
MKLPEVTSNNLDKYIDFISIKPLVRPDEEAALLLAAGILQDENAIEKMFNSHARFVVSVVNKIDWKNRNPSMASSCKRVLKVMCINEGNKALLQSIKDYQNTEQTDKFMSFLLKNVADAIVKGLKRY